LKIRLSPEFVTDLEQKPGKYKAELMAAFGWGRRRLNRALRRTRRLEPITSASIILLKAEATY
jgi:hypothetical protein